MRTFSRPSPEIFRYVFAEGRSHVEAYELLNTGAPAPLSYGTFLRELAATYRAAEASGAKGVLRYLAPPPRLEPNRRSTRMPARQRPRRRRASRRRSSSSNPTPDWPSSSSSWTVSPRPMSPGRSAGPTRRPSTTASTGRCPPCEPPWSARGSGEWISDGKSGGPASAIASSPPWRCSGAARRTCRLDGDSAHRKAKRLVRTCPST